MEGLRDTNPAEANPPRAAEFFAGIGLMRLGLARAQIETAWANDVDAAKQELYVANFGDREFVLADIRDVSSIDVPSVDLATASFPCTDLSVAGNRRGLGENAAPKGTNHESSMFWAFARIIEGMRQRPRVALLENVLGFATSHGGKDLRTAIEALNQLGYSCDVLAIDARHFVAQSRPRMFIVASAERPSDSLGLLTPSDHRPLWAVRFMEANADLKLHAAALPELPSGPTTLEGYVERLPTDDGRWWDAERTKRFIESLSTLQAQRLDQLRESPSLTWRTAYRRTRHGRAVWEIRSDGIAGCLRTARGGSSKQALVETGQGEVRLRWMTAREYARLMGAADFGLPGRRNQALFGFGDAVCVPVIEWVCEQYVSPLLAAGRTAATLLEAA